MAQRLVRAKKKIRDAGVPYRVPTEAELPARLVPVLAVVYLIYTAGHSATSGHNLVQGELCAEAVRLARVLAKLMPEEPEVLGLLALRLLLEARRPARTGPDGEFVPLSEQDRGRWDWTLVGEGQAMADALLRRGMPGPYQVQAAIQAVHADARAGTGTDWRRVLALYDLLLTILPTPVVALNRAVAVAEVAGPAAALALVDALTLADYPPFHVVRADLLARVGRGSAAVQAYDQALELTVNAVERAHLERRRDMAGRRC